MFNCPNCGAPINSDVCPYCETAFIDWSCIDTHKANFIKIKLNGQIVLVRAYVDAVSFNYPDPDPEPAYLYGDNRIVHYMRSTQELQIEASLRATPFKIHGRNQEALVLNIDPEVANVQEAGLLIHNIRKENS